MIRFENVSKIYKGDVAALREVSAEVQKGEFLFLVGPSPDLSSRQLEIARELLGRPPARTVGGVAIWELHPSG